MTDLTQVRAALDEWVASRQVVFSFPMQSKPSAEQLAIWSRLGAAEHKLMSIALTTLPQAQEAAEPVAWRWKPKHATEWIYNPEASWLAQQSLDTINIEPLYATPPATDAPGRDETIEECAQAVLSVWASNDFALRDQVNCAIRALKSRPPKDGAA